MSEEILTEATEALVDEITETAAEAESRPRQPVFIDRPIQTVGRRKEAVVRVRLVPRNRQVQPDGRTHEDYFPNKVHQQLIKAPLVTVDRLDSFDVYAHLDGRRTLRSGWRVAAGSGPGADPGAAGGSSGAQESRIPDP